MNKFKKILILVAGMLLLNTVWINGIVFVFKKFFFFKTMEDIGSNYLFMFMLAGLSFIYISIIKNEQCKLTMHKVLQFFMGLLLGMTTLIVVGILNISDFDFFGIDVYSFPEITLSIVIVMISALASAFAEELIFRGYMQEKMNEFLIKEGSIIISSMFMFLYMMSFGYDLMLGLIFFFMSIMFGYMYEVTKNIFISFGYNFMFKLGFLSLVRIFKYKYVLVPGVLNYKIGSNSGIMILLSIHILVVVTLIFVEKKHVIKKFLED